MVFYVMDTCTIIHAWSRHMWAYCTIQSPSRFGISHIVLFSPSYLVTLELRWYAPVTLVRTVC